MTTSSKLIIIIYFHRFYFFFLDERGFDAVFIIINKFFKESI